MINQFRCPTCQEPLNPEDYCCSQGHCFSFDENGVLCLLDQRAANRLSTFAATVAQRRQQTSHNLLDPAIYDQLPFANSLQNNPEWRWRCDDLAIVQKIIQNHTAETGLRILDVGAYNGWLSHNLAGAGHQVTAVDYFTDPFDGLGAVKHYSHPWQPIQLDLVDLSPLNTRFDVVIMNHGLQFFPDPKAQIQQLISKVGPGGLLILIGLIFYRNPGKRKQYIQQNNQKRIAEDGQPMFFRPSRGFLDYQDRANFLEMGLTLQPYGRFRTVNLLSKFIQTLPWRGYGLKLSPA